MAVIRCADVAAARLCRGGFCAHAAAPLSRETAGDAARRRRTVRSSDGPQRGVRGAERRSASASAPALPVSVAAGGGGAAAAGADAAAGAARMSDWARRARRERLTRRAASGRCASLSGGGGGAAAAGGADAPAGAARLCDSTRCARRGYLTRRAASRAAAVAARGWRWRLVAVVDFEFIS